MKRSIYILLMSCLLLLSCIGCATRASDPTQTITPEPNEVVYSVGV